LELNSGISAEPASPPNLATLLSTSVSYALEEQLSVLSAHGPPSPTILPSPSLLARGISSSVALNHNYNQRKPLSPFSLNRPMSVMETNVSQVYIPQSPKPTIANRDFSSTKFFTPDRVRTTSTPTVIFRTRLRTSTGPSSTNSPGARSSGGFNKHNRDYSSSTISSLRKQTQKSPTQNAPKPVWRS
jgi:hypothetical protein